jgi:2-oxoglutarate dehydrogenase E2 component (dihydrolipoamide succinyltransferase)
MDVLMPQLGETVAEGTVAAWHKKVGDTVAKDEILLDVETDKAAIEIPAPEAGVITAIHVEQGQTVDVGVVLAVINGSDEVDSETTATMKPDLAAIRLVAESETVPQGATEREAEPQGATEREAEPQGATEPEAEPVPAAPAKRAAQSGKRLRLSPVVRRLIAEQQLDPYQIQGSGRNGRITRRDVVAFAEAQKSVQAQVAQQSAPARPAATQHADGERVPFSRIRRLTAEHMVRSKATSPHVLQAVEVDFSGVDQVRLALREEWRRGNGFSLTYLPFIARATCMAIRNFPRINASVDGDGLVIHQPVHLSVAVALGLEGLVAPVIRDAGDLAVSGLARRISEISVRARDKTLGPDDFSGGTYTLSNNGSFGTLMTAPIINQPQIAILSIDAIKKRAVVIEDPEGDAIGIRPIGILSQSFDHRAIDGAYSAAFLDQLRTLLEQRDWSTEF